MEHGSGSRLGQADFSESQVLCSGRRVEACPPGTARHGELSSRELRSLSRERPNAITAGKPGDRAGNFGGSISWPHPRYAGGDAPVRGKEGVLHFPPFSNLRPCRGELGDGFLPFSVQIHQGTRAVIFV